MLDIQNLTVGFTKGSSGRKVAILEGVTLSIAPGDSLGLVGESGSGKSTLGYAIAGALSGLAVQGGSIATGMAAPRIGLVQQNAGQALTPTMTVRRLMQEVFRYNGRACDDATITELLARVRLPNPEVLLTRFPHELSGGQQQRVLIAQTLARKPDILILDEPTTSLDASTRESLLALLAELQARDKFAMLVISHDLGVIRAACRRTAVLYGGIVAEVGDTESIIAGGRHPYTRALLEALPSIDARVMPDAIEGTPPKPTDRPTGCPFAPRCKFTQSRCRDERPVLEAGTQSEAACFFPLSAGKTPARPVTLAAASKEILLSVQGLDVNFPSKQGAGFRALKGVDLSVKRGEILGIIGESGSGKSTLLRCLAGLQGKSAGKLQLQGADDFDALVARRNLATQRRLQLVFQNPATALNPYQTVAQILSAPFQLYHGHAPSAEVMTLTLAQVRLTENHLIKRPKELSGGEKQRVALARGLIAQPDILLLDEVTSALDVSVQAAVLDLLLEIRSQTGTAMIIVSHDIAVMRALTHRLIVLKDGEIVDEGPTDSLIAAPQSDYTRHLITSARALNA